MNARAKLSSKGQIVIPKAVRDAHGWRAGTEFEILDEGNGVQLNPVQTHDPRFPPVTWDEFLALRVKVDDPLPNEEEIDEILLAEAARRFNAARD